jgi:hypothetical protein
MSRTVESAATQMSHSNMNQTELYGANLNKNESQWHEPN